MRQFICRTTDTITTLFGTRSGRTIVSGLATLGLRALDNARSLLVRLSGRKPVCVYLDGKSQMRAVAVPGAARILGEHCLSMAWSRPCRRPVGRGASTRQF
jgi:hypothetical protein